MATLTDTRIAPSAHLPNLEPIQSVTFGPAAWLASFEAVGGAYALTDKLSLFICVPGRTEAEISQARQMIVALSDQDREALLAHLTADAEPTWSEAVERCRADAEALESHPYAKALPGDPDYDALAEENDALGEASSASLHRMIRTPAPDFAGMRQKLAIAGRDYGDDNGVIAAAIADLDRLAPTLGTDEAILAAWERRAAAYARYNALPHSEEPGGAYTPEEQAEWDIIDAAEEIIRSHVAATPQGVAVQLWAALQHTTDYRWDDEACQRRDLTTLESRSDELDWNIRLVVAALRSLKSMEG